MAGKGKGRKSTKSKPIAEAPKVETTDGATENEISTPLETTEYYIRCDGGDRKIILKPEKSKVITENGMTRKKVLEEEEYLTVSGMMRDYVDEMKTRKDPRNVYFGYRLPKIHNLTSEQLEKIEEQLRAKNIGYEILQVTKVSEFIPE